MSAHPDPANPNLANRDPAARYVMPTTPLGRLTLRTFNSTVVWLTRRGLSVWGSRVLYVRGRTSGQWRSNPVNVLTLDGRRYLVAPRGRTQWVRNLRAAGSGELRVGRRVRSSQRRRSLTLTSQPCCARTCDDGSSRWVCSSTGSTRTPRMRSYWRSHQATRSS